MLWLAPSLFLTGCSKPQPLVTRDFEVYLSRRNDIPLKLTGIIGQAKKEVLMTSFEADLPCVFSALQAAQTRGVKVRLLVDDKAAEGTPALLYHFLSTDSSPSSLMHAKFGVVDGKVAWLGSFNLTFSSAYQNDNDLIFFHSPEIAGYLRRVFDSLANGKKPPPAFRGKPEIPVQICLNPECRSVLLQELESAREEIFFSHYVFTDKEIIRVLKEKSAQGVRVEGVQEKSWKKNSDTFRDLTASDVRVAWDRNYYLNHYKVFIVDRKKVITGSYNPSMAAGKNQEIISVISDAEVALFYRQNLERRAFRF